MFVCVYLRVEGGCGGGVRDGVCRGVVMGRVGDGGDEWGWDADSHRVKQKMLAEMECK